MYNEFCFHYLSADALILVGIICWIVVWFLMNYLVKRNFYTLGVIIILILPYILLTYLAGAPSQQFLSWIKFLDFDCILPIGWGIIAIYSWHIGNYKERYIVPISFLIAPWLLFISLWKNEFPLPFWKIDLLFLISTIGWLILKLIWSDGHGGRAQ